MGTAKKTSPLLRVAASDERRDMSQWIGRYELLKELDRGFLGTLWVARFDHDGKSLLALVRALQLKEQFGDEVRELLGEAAWDAMEVSAPGVAAPVDVVFEGESVGLVYDFIEAQPLSVLSRLRAVQQVHCPLPIALRVMCELLKAVQALADHAAEEGLPQAFGGVSPSSVMIATDGRTTLLDPLVAAVASVDERCREHADRVRYLAPEQFRDQEPTPCSDVYAAGCILWELLANRRLHVVSPRRVRERVLAGDVLRLDAIARPAERFDPQLVEAVAAAMAVDPEQRYATPAEFERALLGLGQALAEPGEVREFIEGLASSHLRNQRKVTENSTVADLNRLLRPDGPGARRSRARQATPERASNPLAARIQAAREERLAGNRPAAGSQSAAPTGEPPGRAVSTPFRPVASEAGGAGASAPARLHRGTLIGIPAPAGERGKAPASAAAGSPTTSAPQRPKITAAPTISAAPSPQRSVAPAPQRGVGLGGQRRAASSPQRVGAPAGQHSASSPQRVGAPAGQRSASSPQRVGAPAGQRSVASAPRGTAAPVKPFAKTIPQAFGVIAPAASGAAASTSPEETSAPRIPAAPSAAATISAPTPAMAAPSTAATASAPTSGTALAPAARASQPTAPEAEAPARPAPAVSGVVTSQPPIAVTQKPLAAPTQQPSAFAPSFRDSMTTLVDDAPPAVVAERTSQPASSADDASATHHDPVHPQGTSPDEPFYDGDLTEVDVPVSALHEATAALPAPHHTTPLPQAASELEEDSIGRMALTSLPHLRHELPSSEVARAEETALSVNAAPPARRPAWPAVTWFFAGSSVTLLVVVLVLLGRSESPTGATAAPEASATACAPAASQTAAAPALAPSQSAEQTPNAPTPSATAVATAAETTSDAPTTEQPSSAEAAASVTPPPAKLAPKRRWQPRARQSKPKPKPSGRFIPADL